MELLPGIVAEKIIVVETRHIASHLGSGGVPVYATPSMVLHMEETSRDAVDHLLGPGKATVGSDAGSRLYLSISSHLAGSRSQTWAMPQRVSPGWTMTV